MKKLLRVITMDNWQETTEIVAQHGILPIEDIPNDFLDYLWDYANYIIDDGENNKKLVGHINEEYFYKEWSKEVERFIINKANLDFFDFYHKSLNVLSSKKPMALNQMWVNFQKKYEFNPIHFHSGLFSFIVFLQIPYDLEEEDKVFPFVHHTGKATSRLSFLVTHGHSYLTGVRDIRINVDKSFEGKMLLFPASLQHLVYPFYTSEDYRITVSGNLNYMVD